MKYTIIIEETVSEEFTLEAEGRREGGAGGGGAAV